MDRTANLLGALGLALTDETERVLAASVGLKSVDAAALNVIGQSPGVSIGFISTALDITHAGAVRVVDRLAEVGTVERRAGVDGRTVGLHLTATGRPLWQRQVRARSRFLGRLVDGLAPPQRAALEDVVEQLLATLTSSANQAEQVCRLCDERSCPQDICPVTIACGR
jgi:MarR family transcriptional regulator, negative regulator of the multidrug operon emrRAB